MSEHKIKEKLLKSSQLGEFIEAKYEGKNESGYEPIGDCVMVLPDQASDKSSGGVMITAEMVDRMTMAAETGVIVGMGSDAFLWNGDRSRKWEGPKPQVGDRVYIQRYSGQILMGLDEKFYRVMSDNCIMAKREPHSGLSMGFEGAAA